MNRLLITAALALALLPGCVGMDGAAAKIFKVNKSDLADTGKAIVATNAGLKTFAEKMLEGETRSTVDENPPADHSRVTPASKSSITINDVQTQADGESPNDILVIVVCDLREDGVPLRCYPPQQVLRNEWAGFWRANGGDRKYANGRPMRKFTTHKVIKASSVTSTNDPDDVFVLLIDGYRTERIRHADLRDFFLQNPTARVEVLQMIRAKSVLVPKDDIRIIDVPTVATYPTSLQAKPSPNPDPLSPLVRTASLENWARTEIGRFEAYDWKNIPRQVNYQAGCPCGCNGQCGGMCGCPNCTCAPYAGYQSAGCATCVPGYANYGAPAYSMSNGWRSNAAFMQRGPVRRFISAPFRGGWFPGRGVFRFFRNGGVFRRGCAGC